MRKRVARKVLFGSEGYAVVHRGGTIDSAHRRLKPKWRRLSSLGLDLKRTERAMRDWTARKDVQYRGHFQRSHQWRSRKHR